MATCLVRGAGDVGSAVAHALFRHGHLAVLLEDAAPTHGRRGMSFIDAVYDGQSVLDGVAARRVSPLEEIGGILARGDAIPLVVGRLEATLLALSPDVLIDARMRKRAVPEMQRGLARLTIGLGPNFVVGLQADIAVETAWGADLGAVVDAGATKRFEGEPRPIEGIGRERYVYASESGLLLTSRRLGDHVEAGEVVATLAARALAAPVTGCLRGLTRSGVRVDAGTKVIEVDPRDDPRLVFGIGERPARIAIGVLKCVERLAAGSRTPANASRRTT